MKPYATSNVDNNFVEEIRDWLYSFTSQIETKEEEADSLAKLMHTIDIEQNLGQLNNILLEGTRDFIKTKFEDQLYKFCHRHYKFKFWGWVDKNCFTEGSNALLSRDVLGPKPKHKLHQASDCIIQLTKSTFNKVATGVP